jgi:hypothetical protein
LTIVSFVRLKDHKCFPTYCVLIIFRSNFPKTMIGFNMGLGDGCNVQVCPTSSLVAPLNVASIVGVWGISLVFIVGALWFMHTWHVMLSALQGMELSHWKNVTTIQLVLLKGYFYKIGRHSNVIKWSQPFSNYIILVSCISNLWMQLFMWQSKWESLHPQKIQYLNPLFQMSFVIVKSLI